MTVKVICLNIWEGGILFDDVLDFLRAENADVLLLQEVYNAADPQLPNSYRSVEILRAKLDYPYYDYAPAILDRRPEAKIENGNAIFSRFPISSRDVVFFGEPFGERDPLDVSSYPTTPRNLQTVVVDAGGIPLTLCNFQGVWDLDGDNYSPQRQRMSELILDRVAGQPHLILAGDTNARPTNKAIIAIESQLHSVFGNELASSFNMRRKDDPGYASSFVDMIFVSRDIKVLQKSCPDIDISDHLPLIATVELQ